MATKLRKRDVVVIGLGAAGRRGRAAARAGRHRRRRPRGGHVAEARLSRRTKSATTCAAGRRRAEGQRRDPDAPAERRRDTPRLAVHPMMNARRRHVHPLQGAELAPEPWDFKVVSETTRRYGASRIPKGSTVEDWPFATRNSSRTTTRSSTRSASPARPATSRARSTARQHLRRPAPARVSDAAAAQHRLHRDDGRRRPDARLASVPRPAAITSGRIEDRAGCVYHGYLRARRLPRQREELDGRHHDSEGAEDRPLQRRHRGHVTAIEVDDTAAHRRHLSSRAARSTSSRRTSCCSPATPTRTSGCCCSRSRSAFPNGLSQQPRPGRPALLQPQPVGARVTRAVPVRSQQLVRPAGAGRRGRRLGRRQLRSRRAGLHRRRQSVGLHRAAADRGRQHEHVRHVRRRWGSAWKAFVKENADRSEHGVPPEDDAAVRRQLSRSRSRREGSARATRSSGSPPSSRRTSGRSRAFIQDKMEQWYLEAGAIAMRAAPGRHDGPRTHAYGGTRMGDNPRPTSSTLGLLPRGPESRRARRLGHGHERRAQSDADAAGAGLATAEHLVKNWKTIV